MAAFTTRVELHDALPDTYQTLHSEMAKEGFRRTIRWEGDSSIYYLPTAEYNLNGDYTTQEVLDMARAAAQRAWKKPLAVVVTKSDGPRKQFGLRTQ